MSKTATKSMLSKINKLLDIDDSYKAPERMMQLLSDQKASKKLFFSFLEEFNYDVSYEWFNSYFEDEHADRKRNKQDFTPTCISKLMAEFLEADDGIICEPAAGTGSTVIQHWYKRVRSDYIWNYNPMSILYFCYELSDKTIPFLLFNLMIRGMNAVVIHGNTLTQKAKDVYHVFNEKNNPMGFSTLRKIEHCKEAEEFFGIHFVDKLT
ncbi:MAG: N-6 DNA methylase [Eubacterium sp.]|nr:N-6 DNA methylase [Eubacterium sp.]